MLDRDQLASRRAELQAQLAATTAELEKAEAELETAEAAYRATTDGLAISLRAIERASQNPETTRAELKRLMRQHTKAEFSANAEYAERSSRWGHREGDGYLFACPMGDRPALNRLLITADILGTYRVAPPGVEQPSYFTIGLSRPVATGDTAPDGSMTMTRVRARLRVDAGLRQGDDLTLMAVLGTRIQDSKGADQLRRFLGERLYEAVVKAVIPRSAASPAQPS